MIDVKQFDGLDLPEWMDESQANLICSFLNSLHSGGSKGVRFHLLTRYTVENQPEKPRLYLHLINADKLPNTRQAELAFLALNLYLRVKNLTEKEPT